MSIVLFTGGEDISSTPFFDPEPWHGIAAEIDHNAKRDVSDCLTMGCCLDNDIPVMGICRGMQMPGVVSGAEMIQGIPAWFAELGVEYDDTHLSRKGAPEACRKRGQHPAGRHRHERHQRRPDDRGRGAHGQDLRRRPAIPPGGRAGDQAGHGPLRILSGKSIHSTSLFSTSVRLFRFME
ncbi:MAG: gamma-glutamyl-gamma-aminobutyrate hydrolase family protein [Clostridia bacterium]|nr:gamma-glutamyl-gamma-aminobutyrate hydrolase family protein [Clostridia bacterium]